MVEGVDCCCHNILATAYDGGGDGGDGDGDDVSSDEEWSSSSEEIVAICYLRGVKRYYP